MNGIAEFWSWWETARHRVLASIEVERRFSNELIDDISAHVDAIGDLLDGAFGEDGVERWLGTIERADTPPPGAVPFRTVMDAVAQLERTASGDGSVILQGETETGEPVIVNCIASLKRVDHLLHTMHVAIDLALLERNPVGLTTHAEGERLNLIEDELTAALGTLAVYFGRETRPGVRTLHYYVPEDSAAQAIIERWAKKHAERHVHVEWIRDPTWAFVKQFV